MSYYSDLLCTDLLSVHSTLGYSYSRWLKVFRNGETKVYRGHNQDLVCAINYCCLRQCSIMSEIAYGMSTVPKKQLMVRVTGITVT